MKLVTLRRPHHSATHHPTATRHSAPTHPPHHRHHAETGVGAAQQGDFRTAAPFAEVLDQLHALEREQRDIRSLLYTFATVEESAAGRDDAQRPIIGPGELVDPGIGDVGDPKPISVWR